VWGIIRVMSNTVLDSRVVEPRAEEQEEKLYLSLRAGDWDEFVGQEKAKQAVKLAMAARGKMT
jgi:Holliday junction resolvasome RuvABC ATP-dependent DNA helicase subunit